MPHREQNTGLTDEWYTPPRVFEALGCTFDMDVAHPGLPTAAWVPARRYLTSDSLTARWEGFVWMNPPFGRRNGIAPWLEKFTAHANGIALTPDRTSAPWWQRFAPQMDMILFVSPRLNFINGDPETLAKGPARGKTPAQGTCLMGLDLLACCALLRAQAAGLGRVFAIAT